MKLFGILACVLVCRFSSVRAAECVPGKPDEVTIDSDFHLSWVSNPGECTIQEFIVDVYDSEENVEKVYHTKNTQLNFSSLEICKDYTYDVRAVTTDNVIGPSSKVVLKTPLASDAKIGVKISTVTDDTTTIKISWDLDDLSVSRCVSNYQVKYWDEDSSPVTEKVTGNSFTINSPESCMSYTFQVQAVLSEGNVASTLLSETTIRAIPITPPGTPTLEDRVPSSTTADLLFTVPTYEEYRCAFDLVIDITGAGFDQENTKPVEDSAARLHVITATIQNLESDNVYDGEAWLKNEAGESSHVKFTFQTTS